MAEAELVKHISKVTEEIILRTGLFLVFSPIELSGYVIMLNQETQEKSVCLQTESIIFGALLHQYYEKSDEKIIDFCTLFKLLS